MRLIAFVVFAEVLYAMVVLFAHELFSEVQGFEAATPIWGSVLAASLMVVMWLLNRRKEIQDQARADAKELRDQERAEAKEKADRERDERIREALVAENAKVKKEVSDVKETLVATTETNAKAAEKLEGKVDTVQHTVNHERDEMKAELSNVKQALAELQKIVAIKEAVQAVEKKAVETIKEKWK